VIVAANAADAKEITASEIVNASEIGTLPGKPMSPPVGRCLECAGRCNLRIHGEASSARNADIVAPFASN
jgi:hypothetical protein